MSLFAGRLAGYDRNSTLAVGGMLSSSKHVLLPAAHA